MMKKKFNKIKYLIKIFFLLNLLKTTHLQESDTKESIIIMRARKEGYDLTDPEDEFFLDVCLSYSYNDKDVTLDYKRKYFFFPNNKGSNIKFQNPIRNKTSSCFFDYLEYEYLFKNLSFYFLFPIFTCQFILLIITLFFNIDRPLYNTPVKKKELLNKNKIFCFFQNKINTKNFLQNYSEFIPEVNISQSQNMNETEAHFIDLKKMGSNDLIKKDDNSLDNKKNSLDSSKGFNNAIHYNISDTTDVIKGKKIQESKVTAVFDEDNIDNNNVEGDINNTNKYEDNDKDKKEIDLENNLFDNEKSIDNYTFGMDVQIGYNFNKGQDEKKSNSKNDRDDIFKQKKQEKLKNTELIYNSINKDINKNIKTVKKKHNYIPPYRNENIIRKNTEIIQYIREEYFYFGYLLARIEDKRNIFQIYLDLLEQCQIFFKFFFIPFNIYEDTNIQFVYYGIKIELYFLFNSLLMDNSVVNNIYDNNNFFRNDLYRSILSTLYTYAIGLFIYNLTHIKKTLIKRRYRILNMRIIEQRINMEIYKVTYKISVDYLFHKILILSIAYLFIGIYSFYISYSFCSVFDNSQIYILKGVTLSIIISLFTPFIACWIPSILRKIAISKKNVKLFNLVKFIELLFVA